MSAIARRKPGPRGPRLDYGRILKLLEESRLSYSQIAERVKCSVASVSNFARLPAKKRKAMAAAS